MWDTEYEEKHITSLSDLLTAIAGTLTCNSVKEAPTNFHFSPTALAAPQL